MKAIFYAPMKSPTNPKPSGDRTVARLLVTAFRTLGYDVHILDGFKAYCSNPSLYGEKRQNLLDHWAEERSHILSLDPDLWITYHSYYKAPDIIGPRAVLELDAPYLIFEPSFAPKRVGSPWDAQTSDARLSLEAADLLLPMKEKDIPPLKTLSINPNKIRHLPPFVSPTGSGQGSNWSNQHAGWRARLGLGPNTRILLCTAMMRSGKKRDSYRFLAQSLRFLRDLDWHLVVAGDGPERRSIEADFELLAHRTTFLGKVPQQHLQPIYSAADLFVWPGLGEAYGMVYLEAAASGTPSIAVSGEGVREVIKNSVTGTLVEHRSPKAYADAITRLLGSDANRRHLGQNARAFVETERSFSAAVRHLKTVVSSVQETMP